MQKANKGEWGEPYVVLRLLGDGKLYLSDEEGKVNPNEWMSVLKIIREETEKRLVIYHYDPQTTMVNIEVNGQKTVSILAGEFLKMADILQKEVMRGKGTFAVSDDVRRFFAYAEMVHLKAKSRDKSDIFLTLMDPRSSIVRENIGFSIKTKFGHDPTLFNTAKASGMRYKVYGMNDEIASAVNGIVDDKGNAAVIERCSLLKEKGCRLEFNGTPYAKKAGCRAFEESLDLIDPRLLRVIERILWNHFFEGDKNKDLSRVTERIIAENPCGVTRPEQKYPYMIKQFLYAAYSGLTASTVWDGKINVNGGFISVGKDGVVTANYALESEAFMGYLFKNCYMEYPSTAEGHGDYGKIYKEGEEYFFNLNFQIRYR